MCIRDRGYVGQPLTVTVDIPDESEDLEFLWELTSIPDNSYLINTDIQAGNDSYSVIFIPDVVGDYSIEASVFQYNDEIETQSAVGVVADWDWDLIRNNFTTHLLVDVSYQKLVNELNKDDLSGDDIIDWISKEAESVYKARESLVPSEVIRGFERFVILRTIDEKWKDHLYAMDQLREGINLRAYGQKNPLLEYKSEGFGMFQEMMKDMNAVTAQRIFRTQLQGMEQAPAISSGGVKNVKKLRVYI